MTFTIPESEDRQGVCAECDTPEDIMFLVRAYGEEPRGDLVEWHFYVWVACPEHEAIVKESLDTFAIEDTKSTIATEWQIFDNDVDAFAAMRQLAAAASGGRGFGGWSRLHTP